MGKYKKPVIASCVIEGSIAEEAGIEPGDEIIAVNGNNIIDIFDYRFHVSSENITITIKKPSGETWEIDIDKDEEEDPGIEFSDPLLNGEKSCSNKCLFCFIDQLPPNMRKSLYFKDDDSRLSFIHGNYVTLTNMKDSDLARIKNFRMSPVNVSVHATDPQLRSKMLGNKHAGKIMDQLTMLANAGIEVNCQIVLCRGINDGKVLEKTLYDLTGIPGGIKSISVVPVGLTKFRDNLPLLKPYDRDSCITVLNTIHNLQKEMKQKYSSRIIYAADEFYLMANIPVPDYEEYEDFPQIENGVGMWALLKHEYYQFLSAYKLEENGDNFPKRHVAIATGLIAYPLIKELSLALEKSNPYLVIDVYSIRNSYFGDLITVSGLLTGSCLLKGLKNVFPDSRVETLFISKNMLKADENIFLDDMTLSQVSNELHMEIIPVSNNGEDFISKISRRILL